MTRQIVLDTETTGLAVEKGNRIVEIGCIELRERRPTGRTFHRYLNPDRDFETGAQEVTGLTREFLADKPRFADVAQEFLDFIDGAELIIHNAAFDVGFLDCELGRLGERACRVTDRARVLDTLALARERFPGQRNSLDALCKRFGVDNAHRELHGALLDAELLADVYLAMTAGQGDLAFASEAVEREGADRVQRVRLGNVVVHAVVVSAEERAAHAARLASIARAAGGATVWERHDAEPELEALAG